MSLSGRISPGHIIASIIAVVIVAIGILVLVGPQVFPGPVAPAIPANTTAGPDGQPSPTAPSAGNGSAGNTSMTSTPVTTGDPYIAIVPVTTKGEGDSFIIYGTTNLSAGTEILVEVYSSSVPSKPGMTAEEYHNSLKGYVTVVQGTQGVNTWTFPADTSRFRPDEYLITATSFVPQTSQNVTATMIFNLGNFAPTATQLSPEELYTKILQELYIKISPVTMKGVGDRFIIYGTTNLTAGNEILVEVYPSYLPSKPGMATEAFYSSLAGFVTVVQGTQGVNTWTFPVDTVTFRPDEYIITATAFVPQLSQNITATTLFNIVEFAPTSVPKPNA